MRKPSSAAIVASAAMGVAIVAIGIGGAAAANTINGATLKQNSVSWTKLAGNVQSKITSKVPGPRGPQGVPGTPGGPQGPQGVQGPAGTNNLVMFSQVQSGGAPTGNSVNVAPGNISHLVPGQYCFSGYANVANVQVTNDSLTPALETAFIGTAPGCPVGTNFVVYNGPGDHAFFVTAFSK